MANASTFPLLDVNSAAASNGNNSENALRVATHSDDAAIEVELEDCLPFVQVPHWVLLADISSGALRLYALLMAHLNHKSGNRDVWPSKASLAKMMGLKRSDYVDGHLKQLTAIEAVTILHQRSTSGMKRRNKYRIRVNPPAGYEGPTNLGEWYHPASGKTAGRDVPRKNRVPAEEQKEHNDVSAAQPVPEKNGVRTPKKPGSVPEKNRVKQYEVELEERSKSYTTQQAETLADARAAQNGTRIPENFQAPPESLAWANEHAPNIDTRFETEQFVDYYLAKTGDAAIKDDWNAAWRYWMRDAQKRLALHGSKHFSPAQPKPLPKTSGELVVACTSKEVEVRRDDVELLCNRLADRIEANGSKRPTITKAWKDAARLLLDRDGRSLEQTLTAIDWCQEDEFWRSNVLSMPTLRKQYDRLRLSAMRGRSTKGSVARSGAAVTDDAYWDRAMERARAKSAQIASETGLGVLA